MTAVLAVACALGFATASAFVPLLNAEAYALVAGSRSGPWLALALVPALAVGQTVGKLLLFESGRRGSARFADRLTERRWMGPATSPPVVLASATVGLPPLAVVSIAAGAAGQRRWLFATLCLTGRIVRFTLLVLPVAWAV